MDVVKIVLNKGDNDCVVCIVGVIDNCCFEIFLVGVFFIEIGSKVVGVCVCCF